MKRRIELTPLEDSIGWMAIVPSLPGVITEGDTKAEAIAFAEEAADLYIETLQAKGWDIPAEDEGGIVETPIHDKTSTRRVSTGLHQGSGKSGIRTRTATGKSRHSHKR